MWLVCQHRGREVTADTVAGLLDLLLDGMPGEEVEVKRAGWRNGDRTRAGHYGETAFWLRWDARTMAWVRHRGER